MCYKYIRVTGGLFQTLLILFVAQLIGSTSALAQLGPPPAATLPPTPPPAAAPQSGPSLNSLTWDAIMKEASPQPGQQTADFVFGVNNPTESNIVIDHVQTSCGCTVAKLPSQPWVLTPHTNGQISVQVNLAGKSGTIFKTITVFSTNNEQKVLTVKVNLPEDPNVMRMRNTAIATGDPQAIFKGDCAKCHVDKAKGLLGKQLYVEACGICHEAKPRATMVPDLHALNHPTDYAFWKQIISEGKPKTMMPGFSIHSGGPLTDEQIESLAKTLTRAFSVGQVAMPAGVINTSSTVPTPARRGTGFPPPPPAPN